MNKYIKFPDDFTKRNHRLGSGFQWIYDKKDPIHYSKSSKISVVGGIFVGAEDGINQFEVWFYDEEYPRRYQTIKEINKKLNQLKILKQTT